MKLSLFRRKMDADCIYCEFSSSSAGELFCSKKKCAPQSPCRHFRYAPLKRVPKRLPPLPKYDENEFKL